MQNFFVEHLFIQYCFVFCMIIISVFFVIIEAEMSSSENFNDSAEYISRAEDRRAEHRPPRRKLGNYGAGFGKQGKKPFLES